MDTTLVTGATGFVGSAVARTLAARGHRLRLLVRPTSDRRNLTGIANADPVIGDLTDPSSLERAVAGCRYVFHVAADFRIWVPNPAQMMRANVDGTTALLRAAHAAGAERIIYTSSVAALGINADGSPADENTRPEPEALTSPYRQSKYQAEQAALEASHRGAPVIIVNPTAPVGPRDIKPTATGKMVLDAASGRMPAYIDTGMNIVHVDDVAEGHALAFERGKIGQKYILGGENMELRDLLTLIAQVSGGKAPTMRLSHGMVMPVAAVMETVARFVPFNPPVTREHLRMAKHKRYFSSGKAIGLLGYRPRPVIEAVRDAVAWFREAGMLKR